MILLSILSSSESPIIIKCFFFFVGFLWIIILDYFVVLCYEIGSNISRDLFSELVLHMSCIVIFCRIMSPSMDHRHDKVRYMLCIYERTLLGGCRRSMIKLSNVCPCALKFVKQKSGGNWQLISIDCECFGGV